MNYPAFCQQCNAITGHETTGRTTTCMKCHTTKKSPLARWITGIVLIVATSLFLCWFTISCVLALMKFF